MRRDRARACWPSSRPPGLPGPSHVPGKEASNMSERLSARAGHPAAVRFAKAWGLSPEEWLAYERDMDTQDDYDRWVAEMEGEASDAAKQSADLNISNALF